MLLFGKSFCGQSSTFKALAVCILTVLLSPDSLAETYKCPDQYGDLVISDKPCDNKNFEIIELEGEQISPDDVEGEVTSAARGLVGDIVEWLYNLISEPKTPANSIPAAYVEEGVTYSCTGKKTCGEMFSCGEAIFYLQNCPNIEMEDKDGDGIPCEDLWCTQ